MLSRVYPQSIKKRLPFLISALLAVSLFVFIWVAYAQLRGGLLQSGRARVDGAAQQVSGEVARLIPKTRTAIKTLAANPAVRGIANRPNDPSARAAAEKTLHISDRSSLAVEIRDGRDRLVFTEGTPPRSRLTEGTGLPAGADSAALTNVVIGPLETVGDTIFTRVAVAIPGSSGADGTLTAYLRLEINGGDLLRNLIGTEATVRLGSPATGVWMDLSKAVSPPPMDEQGNPSKTFRDSTGHVHFATATAIAGTPWLLWVELPTSSIISPAREFLASMAGPAILIVLLGALAAWFISRQMTIPLAKITSAAEGIAGGDYSHRVNTTRRDEFGRLIGAFNVMAEQVEDAKDHLEGRVTARTTELRGALEELRSTQEELVRAERLATLGQLAGGVGHELRNPLGVMTNSLYLLNYILADAPPAAKEYLGILKTQVALSEKIVNDLLDFARVKPPQRDLVPVEQIARTQLERVNIQGDVKVNIDIPGDIPPVCVDAVQIGQVVLNLVTNGVQSMGEEPGTLTLTAESMNGSGVRLDVTDTGCGIAPEQLERIFEPLFTTKARGIGLGLSVSRLLVRANGGELTVESRVGEGSTFSLVLPTNAPEAG